MEKKLTDVQLKGEHGVCPVVRVKADNEQGFTEINAHDFNPEVHERHTGVKEKKAAEEINWFSKTKADIIEHLRSLGVEHDPKATKDDLIALIP